MKRFLFAIALTASAASAAFVAGCGGCGETEAERAQRIRTEIQTECDASCTAVTGDEQKHCESTCVANAAANMIASRTIPSNANTSDSPWFWLYLMSQNNQAGATRYVERERVFRDVKPFNEKSYPYAQKAAPAPAMPAPSTSGGSSFWPSTGTSKSSGSLPSTTSKSYGGSSFGSSGSSKSYGGSSFGGGSSSRSYGGSSFGGGSRSYGGSSFGGGRR